MVCPFSVPVCLRSLRIKGQTPHLRYQIQTQGCPKAIDNVCILGQEMNLPHDAGNQKKHPVQCIAC